MTTFAEQTNMQIPHAIRAELAPGEQVIWSGQPTQGLLLRGSDAMAIPFSLFFAGFSVYWMIGAANSGAAPSFVLFGLPFVLMGMYLIVGRFLSMPSKGR